MIRLVSSCHMPGYCSVKIFSHIIISGAMCLGHYWTLTVRIRLQLVGKIINEIDCDV